MRRLDLVQLGRVDIDVDDLRARGQNAATLPVARSSKRAPTAISRSHSSSARFAQRRAVLAQHAQQERMVRRHHAERHQASAPSAALPARPAAPRAAPRRCGPRRRRGTAPGVRRQRSSRPPHRAHLASAGVGGARLPASGHPATSMLRVCTSFGMSMSTGPGRPDIAMAKARGITSQQLLRGVHHEVVLGHRQRHAEDVHLLKGVGADLTRRHLPGDRHQRNRIQLGVGDRGEQIGGAGAGGGQAHRRPCRSRAPCPAR